MKINIFTVLFLMIIGLNCFAETPVSSNAEENFTAAVVEASLFLKGGEYQNAARRATEAAFMTERPSAAGWDEAVRISLEAAQKLRDSKKFPAKPVRRVKIYREQGILLLLEEGFISNVFEVHCGNAYNTPAGRFMIGKKLRYPNWELDGKLHRLGTSENILGARWMEIKTADGPAVSGIHGSSPKTKENKLGFSYFSMENNDVRRLYDLLPEGTVVEVE